MHAAKTACISQNDITKFFTNVANLLSYSPLISLTTGNSAGQKDITRHLPSSIEKRVSAQNYKVKPW